MLFGHTRYKKLKKTLPLSRNRHVKLSWNRKNPHRQRGFGPVSSSLGRCMLNIHTCMLNIHTCSTYIHTCSTYIHTCSTYMHTYIPTQLMRGIHMYVSMYVCMHVCMSPSMYVCMFETVNHHPRAGSDSSRKTFSIERFIQFFEICEGGYFQRP